MVRLLICVWVVTNSNFSWNTDCFLLNRGFPQFTMRIPDYYLELGPNSIDMFSIHSHSALLRYKL